MNDNNNNSIVVYNSQYERQADMYLSKHPEYGVAVAIALFIFVIVVFAVALRKIFKK